MFIDFLDTVDHSYWFPWHQRLLLLISLTLRIVIIDFLDTIDCGYWFTWLWGLWLLISLTLMTVGTDFHVYWCIGVSDSCTYWLLVLMFSPGWHLLTGPGYWCFCLAGTELPHHPPARTLLQWIMHPLHWQGQYCPVCLSVCPPALMSVCLSVCLSVYLSASVSVCLPLRFKCMFVCICSSSVPV